MQVLLICAGILVVPVMIYIFFRLASLGWFTSKIEIVKIKPGEIKNERRAKKNQY